MRGHYVDFHTHTKLSDGMSTPAELVKQARAAGIGTLAITDHNYTGDLAELRRENPDIRLIQGAEISCIYTASDVGEKELHVVGLGIDPENAALKAVLTHNQPDRRPYVEEILARLRDCGVDVGDYTDLVRRNPGTVHLGRMQIARRMKELGYVDNVDAAFDIYIGAFGQRRAYVPNPLRYVSLEEAVAAIRSAGGIAVLAHLYYYQLSDAENLALVRYFKSLAADQGAMEVFYGRYSQAQRENLARMADAAGLMYSAASDYHGNNESDTLDNRILDTQCRELLNRLTDR